MPTVKITVLIIIFSLFIRLSLTVNPTIKRYKKMLKVKIMILIIIFSLFVRLLNGKLYNQTHNYKLQLKISTVKIYGKNYDFYYYFQFIYSIVSNSRPYNQTL